jgi:two-component system nitrate/nitrite response regulator NarP
VLRDTSFHVVAALDSGSDVLDAVAEKNPELLLLDINMPGRTGVEILRILRERGDKRPIVLLSAAIHDPVLVDALQLGVNGLILKDDAPGMLLTCLAHVRNGQRWIDRNLLERGLDLTLNGQSSGNAPLAELTPRETAIAKLVARGLRNREIGNDLGLTEGTVKVWLHRIYEKLGVSNRTELALLVRSEDPRS